MSDAVATVGKKALAVLILVAVAYVLFKLVIGLVTSVVWFLVLGVAVVAVIWAVRVL